MKVGVLLPTFRRGADDALDFAERAANAHLDGVFAYDHLWPMGTPTRPSLAPFGLLAVVATRHEELCVGPLVARVGMVSTAHLVEQFRTLESLAPGRVIAALGTGDKLSAPENAAYGLEVRSADERRALLAATHEQLAPTLPVWFGAGSSTTNELARTLGATLNLWGASAARLATECVIGPTSWAGPAPDDLEEHLDALSRAGANWAIFSPDVALGPLEYWRTANEVSRFS
jgi:alkanesulfonate monooxygenase SsuD/methylene tetrahydromethanopterin reductase-like flavin-dependent oxidoreductase (luciferase family)